MSPRTLLAAHNLYPKKQMGQNFLSDPSAIQRIIERSGFCAEDTVLEIGAGLGALTIPLSRMVKTVYAVDKDTALLSILKTQLLLHSVSNVTLIEKDVLKLNFQEMADNAGQSLIVSGNLPYNISSQILVRLIDSRHCVRRAILMFQKELAERIMSRPDSKDYGRITAMLRYCADIRSIAKIGANCFYPKPNVDSEVVEISFHAPKYPAKDETMLFKVIKAAFGQRRKTLKNALSGSELHIPAQEAQAMLEASGIDPNRRAETLEIEEFVRLSDQVSHFQDIVISE